MGKCYYCNTPAVDGKSLCKQHAQKKRDDQKRIREQRMEKKLCTNCGSTRDNATTQCNKCKENNSKSREKRIAERKKNNCCPMCGRDKSFVKIWHHRLCAECHLRQKFSFTGTKEEAEKLINDMLKNQQYKCALSGRDLKNNKYHIDHIVPKSIDPKIAWDPANWQIIVEDANFFKSNKNMEDLLLVALDIVKQGINTNKYSPEIIQQLKGILDEHK